MYTKINKELQVRLNYKKKTAANGCAEIYSVFKLKKKIKRI